MNITENRTKVVKKLIYASALWILLTGCAQQQQSAAPSADESTNQIGQGQYRGESEDSRPGDITFESAPAKSAQQQIIDDYIAEFESRADAGDQHREQKVGSESAAKADLDIITDVSEADLRYEIDPAIADEQVSLNFDEVDIRTMIRTIGDITGTNFIIDESVTGTVTVISPGKIRLGDINNVLSSILEVKGHAAIAQGNGMVKIVPRAKAVTHGHSLGTGVNPELIDQSDSLVTQIIALEHAKAGEIAEIARPLLPRDCHMSVYERTNTLIITAGPSTVRHIARIIENLDVAGHQRQTRVIQLEYASAATLGNQLTEITGKSGSDFQSRSSDGGPDVRIIPDARTNSLIIVAQAPRMQQIELLIEQLDVQQPMKAGNVNVVYLENASAEQLAESLRQALSGLRTAGALDEDGQVQISADEGTNALIIAASAQDFETIQGIVKKLDIFREQVLVEMMILEISQDSLNEIGIDWATLDRAVTDSVRGFGATNFNLRTRFEQGQLEGLAVGAWREVAGDVQIGAILHALDKKSGVNILSTPHVLTSNHNTARIVVGENRPFVTRSRITEDDPATPTVVQTFEYKDVGITLEITPHISQGGNVRLEIFSEFTKLIEDVTVDSLGTPITAKRQAETVVAMQSGKTIVIGGLIRDDKVTVRQGIPIVSELPLVGNLFSYQRDRIEKTNLLIFITPTVLGSIEEMEQMTQRKTYELETSASQINGQYNRRN